MWTTSPVSPARANRGWLVFRHKSGNEIFRSDINLFMDGGLGVITEDAQQLTDVLLKSSVKMMDDKRAIEVFGAILQRLEGMQSPWAKMNWSAASNGVECYHENALGKRTKERFVVDLRLERVR